MLKTAFITGINGQDGSYLAKFLLQKNYRVIGGIRRSSLGEDSLWRLKELNIFDQVKLIYCDLTDLGNIIRTITHYNIDEFYNLGAQSFVGCSFELPVYTSNVDYIGTLNCLEAIRIAKPNTKFYQASTSEMYGKIQESKQTETTPFYPRSPYAVAKLAAHWITINYRESYNLFAASGILFNHESPLRGEEFVTRKITKGLAKIKLGLQNYITLGNLDSKRDWGYAGDYIEGMYLILQNDYPDDFVLATGECYSIRQFIEISGKYLGYNIEWRGKGENEIGIDTTTQQVIIKISSEFYRPTEVDILLGDSSKAKKILGWTPKVNLEQLIEMMITSDMEKLKNAK